MSRRSWSPVFRVQPDGGESCNLPSSSDERSARAGSNSRSSSPSAKPCSTGSRTRVPWHQLIAVSVESARDRERRAAPMPAPSDGAPLRSRPGTPSRPRQTPGPFSRRRIAALPVAPPLRASARPTTRCGEDFVEHRKGLVDPPFPRLGLGDKRMKNRGAEVKPCGGKAPCPAACRRARPRVDRRASASSHGRRCPWPTTTPSRADCRSRQALRRGEPQAWERRAPPRKGTCSNARKQPSAYARFAGPARRPALQSGSPAPPRQAATAPGPDRIARRRRRRGRSDARDGRRARGRRPRPPFQDAAWPS